MRLQFDNLGVHIGRHELPPQFLKGTVQIADGFGMLHGAAFYYHLRGRHGHHRCKPRIIH